MKNGTAYFPQYVDAITSISVWGHFSWEKLYQDQQFWFSSLFSRVRFVRQCRGPKLSLFSLNEGLSQLWAVIQLTLSMHILYSRNLLVTMRIDKVNLITAHNCGKPKWHSFTPSLSWKGRILGLNIVSQMCPRTQTTWPKLLILVSFFSGEVTSYTNSSYCIHILWEVRRSVFHGPPCITNPLPSLSPSNPLAPLALNSHLPCGTMTCVSDSNLTSHFKRIESITSTPIPAKRQWQYGS